MMNKSMIDMARQNVQHGVRSVATPWKALLTFFLLTFFTAIVGNSAFQKYKSNIKEEKRQELGAIATLKAEQIKSWMDERKGDAQVLRDDALIALAMDRWIRNGARHDVSRVRLLERINAIQRNYSYASITFLDDQARTLLSTASTSHATDIHDHNIALEAIQSGKINFSDFHRTAQGNIELDIITPIAVGSRTIGAIVFKIDPRLFLYPLIQGWPTTSPSAETLLLERNGESIVYLNELRHQKNMALVMTRHIEQANLLASMAIKGKIGIAEGVDYRGVPVVGIITRVPDTSWYMIAKIDSDELHAPINRLANWIIALTGIVVISGACVTIFWWLSQRRHYLDLQSLYETELEHRTLTRHIDYLAKYANDIIMLLNGQGGIILANDRAAEAYGYTIEEMLKLNIADVYPAEGRCEINEILGKTKDSAFCEATQQHRNGATFMVEISLRAFEIDGENFFQVIARDITERKQVEDKLHRYNEELEFANHQLQNTQSQLLQSEKMASIGQLAAGVAHEINNPIGYVYSNLSTLEKYVQDAFAMIELYEKAESAISDDAVRAKLKTKREKMDIKFLRDDLSALMNESKDGIIRVKNIVQNLKDFSHVDTSDEWQWANLHKGLDSTLNIVWNEIKYHAEVNKEYGEIPEVQCYPMQLNQVFMNLLVNAAQAITDKGVITIRTGLKDEKVFIQIVDTGDGIPEENIKRIFDPFFTTKPVGKGTGLGLSLSYGIMQKHHGSIEVQSEVGKGTTFTLWLPVKQPNWLTQSDIQ